MEMLENELDSLISKLKNADDFRSEVENIQNGLMESYIIRI